MSILDVTKEQILSWLVEHEQVFRDFCEHFDIDEKDSWFNE